MTELGSDEAGDLPRQNVLLHEILPAKIGSVTIGAAAEDKTNNLVQLPAESQAIEKSIESKRSRTDWREWNGAEQRRG